MELAKTAWDDVGALEIELENRGEPRWGLVARVKGEMHTVVFTRRGDNVRLITMRRSHPNEERLYEKDSER